jgi:hypothetical protein
MSSHITSDYTVLAIVQGMQNQKMIGYRDRYFMAGALRAINEAMTWKRWNHGGNALPIENEHAEVDWKKVRKFSDAEIWVSCKCWLYQVETGDPMDFDFITLVAGVKKLLKGLERKHLEDKSWKCRCYFGNWHFFEVGEDGDATDLLDIVEWDLAA